MNIVGFDHIVLCVENVRQTVLFYTRYLKMEAIEERPGKWSLHFGNQKISLQDAATRPKIALATVPGSGNFCLMSDTPVSTVIADLRENDIDIIEGPVEREGAAGRILSIYFRDPDANLIEVCNQVGLLDGDLAR